MPNESKVQDQRFWKRWKGAGAVGGVPEAELEAARARGPIEITAIGEHFSGTAAGDSTLSLGEKAVAGAPHVTKPEIAVVAKGHGYKLGQKIEIPKKAKPVSRVFDS